jgi:hypothetical protein
LIDPFVGDTAEAILEMPGPNNILPNYGTTEISIIVQGKKAGLINYNTASSKNVAVDNITLTSRRDQSQIEISLENDPSPDGTTFAWQETN